MQAKFQNFQWSIASNDNTSVLWYTTVRFQGPIPKTVSQILVADSWLKNIVLKLTSSGRDLQRFFSQFLESFCSQLSKIQSKVHEIEIWWYSEDLIFLPGSSIFWFKNVG